MDVFKIGDYVRMDRGHQRGSKGKVVRILPGDAKQLEMVTVQFDLNGPVTVAVRPDEIRKIANR